MVKLAVLHETLPVYMRQSQQEDLRHLELACSATTLKGFREQATASGAQVLVVDLGLLGEAPIETVTDLERRLRPEMTVVVYSFAKWNVIEALRGEGRTLMRAPVSVRALRSNLINLIVRQISPGSAPAGDITMDGKTLPASQPPARMYDDVQLAGLQEVRSQVDCECPNQVADLVIALNAFEDYSRDCENRNEADARVHAMLARATGHARATMERAMRELCEFEQIDVGRMPGRERTGE